MHIFYNKHDKVFAPRNDQQELGMDAVIETGNGCFITHRICRSWSTHSNVRQNQLPATSSYSIEEEIFDYDEASYYW